MKTRAIQRNVHVSSRKANLVCELIRNKKVADAITILDNTSKKTAKILKKILQSAMANATNNHAMKAEALYVYGAIANQGRTLKRALPRAKGSSNMIRKRHSHLEIILSDDINQREADIIALKAKKPKKVAAVKKEKTNAINNKPKIVKKEAVANKPAISSGKGKK